MARSLLGGFPEAFVNTYLALDNAQQAKLAMQQQTARDAERLKLEKGAQELQQKELDRRLANDQFSGMMDMVKMFEAMAPKPLTADQKIDNEQRAAAFKLQGANALQQKFDELVAPYNLSTGKGKGAKPDVAAKEVKQWAKTVGLEDMATPELLESMVKSSIGGTLSGDRVPRARMTPTPAAGMMALPLAMMPGFGLAAPGLLAGQDMTSMAAVPIPQSEREAMAADMPTEAAAIGTEYLQARTENLKERTEALQQLEEQRKKTGELQSEMQAARIVAMQAKTDLDKGLFRLRSKVADWNHSIAQQGVGLESRRVSIAAMNAETRTRKGASDASKYLLQRIKPLERDLDAMNKEQAQYEALYASAQAVIDKVQPTGVPGADRSLEQAYKDRARAMEGRAGIDRRRAQTQATVDEAKRMLGLATQAAGSTVTTGTGKPLLGGANGLGTSAPSPPPNANELANAAAHNARLAPGQRPSRNRPAAVIPPRGVGSSSKKLTKALAIHFLQAAGGNRQRAQAMAQKAGFRE